MFKIGRTTGHTVGRLHNVDASVTIHYAADEDASFQLKGKAPVVYSTGVHHTGNIFADCGDSGALVINGNAEAVGMVVAAAMKGSVARGVAYLSPIAAIMKSIPEILRGEDKMQVEML